MVEGKEGEKKKKIEEEIDEILRPIPMQKNIEFDRKVIAEDKQLAIRIPELIKDELGIEKGDVFRFIMDRETKELTIKLLDKKK